MDGLDGMDEAFTSEFESSSAGVVGYTLEDVEPETIETEGDMFRGRRGRSRRGRRRRGGGLALRRIERKLDAIALAVGADNTQEQGAGADAFVETEFMDGESADTEDEMNAGSIAIDEASDMVLEESLGAAANTSNNMTAQSLTGATVLILANSPPNVQRLAPAVVDSASRLVRYFRRTPRMRPLVRVVPAIIKRSVATLNMKAAKGKPVSVITARRVTGKHAKATLRSPRKTREALRRNSAQRSRLSRNSTSKKARSSS